MSFNLKPLLAKSPSHWMPPHWPNRQTVSTSMLIVANVVCQILDSSSLTTIGLNIPLRIFSVAQALSSGKSYKVAMDILGFGVLFLPYNRLISIGLDTVSEVINFYDRPKDRIESVLEQRGRYESEKLSCVEVILDYLKNPEDKTKLTFLGFSPEQLEKNITESDLAYFRAALSQSNKSQKEAIAQLYPGIKKQLCQERVDQELKELRERSENTGNFYQETLHVLKAQVIGQDRAAEKMAATLASQENQTNHKVFLFVGPTGVGKTELAKAVSKTKKNRFIMFPMKQYQKETDISKLFGSSTGYVGSTDKPHFVKEMDRYNPIKVRSDKSKQFYEITDLVILFDEFEKAHSAVKQSLLTLFDEGYCVVNYTEGGENITIQYDLKRCVVICTSNLYQKEIVTRFQNGDELEEISKAFVQDNSVKPVFEGGAKKSFSPELLGRITIIPFGPIPKGECYQKLIGLKFKAFCSTLKEEISCKAIDIENENLILESLENKLYGEGVDIRRVGRYLDSVKDIIYKNLHLWGSLGSKKILFSCDTRGVIYMTPLVWIEDFEEYHPLVSPVMLP